MLMERPKMVVFVVKRYVVRETEKWQYALRKPKIRRYAVRKGEGVSPSYRQNTTAAQRDHVTDVDVRAKTHCIIQN